MDNLLCVFSGTIRNRSPSKIQLAIKNIAGAGWLIMDTCKVSQNV